MMHPGRCRPRPVIKVKTIQVGICKRLDALLHIPFHRLQAGQITAVGELGGCRWTAQMQCAVPLGSASSAPASTPGMSQGG